MNRIAILGMSALPWVARFQDGMRAYAKAHGGWEIFCCPPPLSDSGESGFTLRSMAGWNGDGIIISSNDINVLYEAKNMGIPVLNLAGGQPENHGIPRIMVDHYAAGCMAAEHMIELGLVNLAYFGWKTHWYSDERCRGFQDYASERGASCQVLLSTSCDDATASWTDRIAVLAKWLTSLKLPCGIFAVQDYRAQLLIEACREVGLRVPYDIALVGMDNDETVCEHTHPTLSSISRNEHQMGFEAASILCLMIRGKKIPSDDILIPPAGIVIRESSDMMYTTDPLIREAVEYMRENLNTSFNIEAVADRINISKRTLEKKFSEITNCSPRQYLTKLRVYHAKTLIRLDPEKTVETLVDECGFGTAKTFNSAFQRIAGTTPVAFRETILKDQCDQYNSRISESKSTQNLTGRLP